MKPISLLLVDDHQLLLDAWELIFSIDPRFKIVGSTSNAADALIAAKKYSPDIALVDISMTPVDGIELCAWLQHVDPAPRVIAVSLHASIAYARRMIHAGAVGYVTKNSSKEELMQAITEVAEGRNFICEEMRDNLAHEQFAQNDPGVAALNMLSKRQIEVIGLIQQGLSSREIGARLGVKTKTIEIHRYHIMQKTGMPNTAALVNLFSSRGW